MSIYDAIYETPEISLNIWTELSKMSDWIVIYETIQYVTEIVETFKLDIVSGAVVYSIVYPPV